MNQKDAANAIVEALSKLADSWDSRADQMERECKKSPCPHCHGYRQAAYELRLMLPLEVLGD